MDPDPHLKSSLILNHIENNCWIRIRKKLKKECESTDMLAQQCGGSRMF